MTSASNEWLSSWLKRLEFDREPSRTLEGLNALIRAQQRAIPFENIDVMTGKVPSLELERLTRKLIDGCRGGYCFELNRVMETGLRAVGFPVTTLLARVMWQRSSPSPRTHSLLQVELSDQTWLVDVGFGGPCPAGPIPLSVDLPATEFDGQKFKFEDLNEAGWVLKRQFRDREWIPLYSFTFEPVFPGDLEAGNWLAATMPDSIFRDSLKVARFRSRERLVMDGTKFRRYSGNEVLERRSLDNSDEIIQLLTDQFGLKLDFSTEVNLRNKLEDFPHAT